MSFADKGPVNILSLGAGYDTTVFWLHEVNNGQLREMVQNNVTYIEVDYDQVVNRKIEIIRQNKVISDYIIEDKGSEDGTFINAKNYKLLAQDARKTEEMTNALINDFQVDPTRPTLLLTECLLVYLKPEDSVKILQWAGELFKESPFLGIMNYEMIEPFDSFGQTMITNLMDRGCDLLGIEETPTLEAQDKRMASCLQQGTTANAVIDVETITMNKVYDERLDKMEKARIEQLEIFDEFEEWVLLQNHYCISVAKRYVPLVKDQAQLVKL